MALTLAFEHVTSADDSQLESGFTLIELVLTLTVMTILTAGMLPLAQVGIRRQREQRLRETLREIRSAIDEFHRDTAGLQCVGTATSWGQENVFDVRSAAKGTALNGEKYADW